MLDIKDLKVKIGNRQILNKVNLSLPGGEIHVIMGPNGSGKSTLSKAAIGHPDYEVSGGEILMDGIDILDLEPNERAVNGLFVAMQYPTEIPGVNMGNFLRLAYNSRFEKDRQLPVFKFKKKLREKLDFLNMSHDFIDRNLNEGFSGGEKKKSEILQMAVLEPKYAILDETDSGLDVDALKVVFNGVKKLIEKDKNLGVIIITHYHRIFDYINPNKVYILKDGQIVATGKKELADKVDKKGYAIF